MNEDTSKTTNQNENGKKESDMYSDLPMPRVAAVTGWFTFTFFCFAIAFAGKAITCAVARWDIKLSIIDVLFALVAGTIIHSLNRKNHKEKRR